MALAEIRHEIVLALAQTHDAQHDALLAYRDGSDGDKVIAAGELDFLARQEQRLRQRLADVDRRAAESRTMFSWFRQEWFSLMFHLESWIAHG